MNRWQILNLATGEVLAETLTREGAFAVAQSKGWGWLRDWPPTAASEAARPLLQPPIAPAGAE